MDGDFDFKIERCGQWLSARGQPLTQGPRALHCSDSMGAGHQLAPIREMNVSVASVFHFLATKVGQVRFGARAGA